MAPLSRVQLAAALIEYDNDDPYAGEPRFARESAILANVKAAAPRGRAPRRQRTRPPSEAYGEDEEVDAPARRSGGSPPPPSVSKKGDRRSWITVQEPHLMSQQPVSPPDFRRSASPFMAEVPTAAALAPAPQPTEAEDPPWSARTFASEETSSSVPLHHPAPPIGKLASALASQVPTAPPANERPPLAAPVPTRAPAAPLIAANAGALSSDWHQARATLIPSIHRPPSGQGLDSFTPASSSPPNPRPLPEASISARSPSFGGSVPLRPPSRSSSVPLEMQLRDQSMSLFAVPFFETPAAPPITKTTRRRSKSPFRFLSPKTSPSASLALLPDELALRDAISALPRSLGGDPPSGDHRQGMGPRARTGSMGDWETLVFKEHDGFQSDSSLSNIRSFSSRSAAASQVFFDDDADDGALIGAASGAIYGPDGAIVKKSRSQSVDVLSTGGVNGIVRRSIRKGAAPAASKPAFKIPDFDKPTSAAAPAAQGSQAPAAPPMGLELSTAGESPIMVAPPLPDLAVRPIQEREHTSVPLATDRTHRRASVASSFDIISSTSRHGQTPPLADQELVPAASNAAVERSSVDTRRSVNARPRSLLGELAVAATPAEDSRPVLRPESSLSLLDEIDRLTPGLLAEPAAGRDVVEEVRRSLQQSRLSEHADRDGTEVEYLAEDDVEREREKWLPPPSKGRASRFDPANNRSRKTSFLGVPDDEEELEADDEDDARRRPGKPKGAPRSTSLAHFKQSGRLATSATSSIYLPPVLVMPALLDPSAHEEGEAANSRGFFQTAAKPLPIDFKSRPPLHHSRSSSSFIASASALAIPTRSLTLAQKTFRASLVVDGKRGGDFLGSALEEGDKAFDENDEDDASDHWMIRPDDEYRGPGTLYGRSLMDTLELRKKELANKKRTFRGDSRPAMFTRSATETSFLSAPSLRGRPQSVYPNPTFPTDGDAASVRAPGMSQRASVFGLDKHWQDAMAEREEEDRQLAEIEQRREEAEEAVRAAAEAKRASKLKGKKRMSSRFSSQSGLAQAAESLPTSLEEQPAPDIGSGVGLESPTKARMATLAPSLSLGDFQTAGAIEDMFSDDEQEPDGQAGSHTKQRSSRVVSRAGWESSEDDVDGQPKKQKQPASGKSAQPLPKILATRDDTSSEEDVPLAARYNLPSLRTNARPSSFFYHPPAPAVAESSDEEVPLSQLVRERANDGSSSAAPGHTPVGHDPAGDDDDDDDVPLGVRHSTYQQRPDEDDVPLGLSQAQHLQQQYYQQQAAAAQQAQMYLMQQQQVQQQAMHQQRMMMAAAYGGMAGYGGGGPMPGMQPSPHAPKDEKIARWREEVPTE